MESLETLVLHEVSKDMPSTCPICFDHDLEAEQMLTVDFCHHQFCLECVKRYIEVKLVEGGVLSCPHYQFFLWCRNGGFFFWCIFKNAFFKNNSLCCLFFKILLLCAKRRNYFSFIE